MTHYDSVPAEVTQNDDLAIRVVTPQAPEISRPVTR
jgi:hypothetical protein